MTAFPFELSAQKTTPQSVLAPALFNASTCLAIMEHVMIGTQLLDDGWGALASPTAPEDNSPAVVGRLEVHDSEETYDLLAGCNVIGRKDANTPVGERIAAWRTLLGEPVHGAQPSRVLLALLDSSITC